MGASSWWGTTNRQPPLASAPNWLGINVDLTPFKLSFGMQAIVCFAQRGLLQTVAQSHNRNRWSFPFNASTINGTSNNLGSSQKTKQLFKARARFCSCARGTSIELLPQRTSPNERRRSHHFLCLCLELSLCINARPHTSLWPNQNHQFQKSEPKRSRLLLWMARQRMAWVVKKFCVR